jgi:shikimate dehydrogenase
MVCNATSMGMAAGDPLPVAANSFTPSMFVGDVIARHGATPLLQAARTAGCKTANGVQVVEAVREIMLDFMLRNRSRLAEVPGLKLISTSADWKPKRQES